jgi:hypothetical protein
MNARFSFSLAGSYLTLLMLFCASSCQPLNAPQNTPLEPSVQSRATLIALLTSHRWVIKNTFDSAQVFVKPAETIKAFSNGVKFHFANDGTMGYTAVPIEMFGKTSMPEEQVRTWTLSDDNTTLVLKEAEANAHQENTTGIPDTFAILAISATTLRVRTFADGEFAELCCYALAE